MAKQLLKERFQELAGIKSLSEEMSFDSDIENKTEKDFGFWFRAGARGEAQALKAQELLTQKGIDKLASISIPESVDPATDLAQFQTAYPQDVGRCHPAVGPCA